MQRERKVKLLRVWFNSQGSYLHTLNVLEEERFSQNRFRTNVLQFGPIQPIGVLL